MMNSNEHPLNERQALTELLGDDRFDDSVCDQHKNELRSKVLEAFDHPKGEVPLVQPDVLSIEKRRSSNGSRSLGYATILAICLIGIVSVGLHVWNASVDRSIVDDQPISHVAGDLQLLASLVEVNAFRDEVSRDELFDAIAMCQQDYEGRMLVQSAQPWQNRSHE